MNNRQQTLNMNRLGLEDSSKNPAARVPIIAAHALITLSILTSFNHTASALSFVSETEKEFICTGDFDGNGKTDVALVDREKGRVRYGFMSDAGALNWVDWRGAGMDNVSGVAVGKLADLKHDSLAFTSADENLTSLLDSSNQNFPSNSVALPITSIGPNIIIATDIGGENNNAFDDIYIPSIYNNDPTPNMLTLFRNSGKEFKQLSQSAISFTASRGNRIPLKSGGKEYATFISTTEQGIQLIAAALDSGKPETVLSISDVPSGSDYVVGNFRGEALREFLFYKVGEPTLTVCPVTETGGKFLAGKTTVITLSKPITQLVTVDGGKKSRILAVYGETDPAELLDFDAVNPPVLVQSLSPYTNTFLHGAAALSQTVVLISWEYPAINTNNVKNPKSMRYQAYALKDGKYEKSKQGNLPVLDDRDESTVVDIHKFIVATLKGKTEADMAAYTNDIPGTDQTFVMTPIPGGEFLMGSPANEKGRKSDEGPEHRVKISPFWMATHEVTWKQFNYFTYVLDEQIARANRPTPEEINLVSDAVTRPSKPYGDMAFGLGSDKGKPVISMTQHAANKYCQWLSAKTGHFYRLPTEAEWEYACRAGSTNAYSFGENPADLPENAWFFENGDSKYQKVGKKLPNAWGLYDMHGNVAEWVLDQYDETFYGICAAKGIVVDPWNIATKPYPHVFRGGSYDNDAPDLRSAARRKSGPEWKLTYPNLPKTIWWLSDWTQTGFRIVRPLKVPPPEEMAKYWISGVEKD